MPHPHPSAHLRAIGFALAGFTFWVMGDMFIKLATELSVPKHEFIALSAFGGLVSIFALTALRGGLGRLRPQKYSGLIAMGFLFLISYVFAITALTYLPLTHYYTILFLSPILVAFFATILLHEKLSPPKILATLAGFVGIVIAVNPTHLFNDKSLWMGYAAAFLSVLTIASQQLMLRFMGNHESRESTAFYPRFGALLGGLIAMLIFGFEPISAKGLFYSLACGGIGGMGWVCMAQAYKLAPAATIAPFQYSEIIIGAVLGYFLWHDIPSARLLVGASFIIASGLYIINHTRKAALLVVEDNL